MQEIIDSQKEIINSKNKEIDILKNKIKDIEIEKKNEISNVKNLFYENWKQMNGMFVKKIISEMLSNKELSFSFDEGYSGYFTMNVHMNDEILQSYSGQICIYDNGLDE